MILVAALLPAIAGASHASESIFTEVTASEDAFLRVSRQNSNEGANEFLVLQGGGINRVVVGFDLLGITRSSVSSARLVLTVGRNFRGWGPAGRAVDVHPLLASFAEGNGKTYRVGRGKTRGSGAGVTWACASDASIGNVSADCAPTWAGGLFGPASDSVVHTNATAGEVTFDVTADVVAGASAWIVKHGNEKVPGRVHYVSREGAAAAGDPCLAPRLEMVSCVPSAEMCNGRDDDCDGAIDEDVAPVPTTCGVGACADTGSAICVGGRLVDSCVPGDPETESCYDAVDNDCDGTVDDGCPSCASVGGTTLTDFAGCWYLGAYGQSCNAVCTAHGLVYSDLTRTVVGSDGSLAGCDAALTTLGAHPEGVCDGTLSDGLNGLADDFIGAQGIGCGEQDLVLDQPNRCDESQHFRRRWEWMRFPFSETTGDAALNAVRLACSCEP